MRARYTSRSDLTQKAIVEALRAIGAQVYVIGRPVDLLVSYGHRTLLLECKSKGGKIRTPAQRKFIDEWQGELRVVDSVDKALDAVVIGRRG